MNAQTVTVAEALTQLRSIQQSRGNDLSIVSVVVIEALEALAREQTAAARLLGYIEDAKQTAETWKTRAEKAEALAREKADAVPSPDSPTYVPYWKSRAEAAETNRNIFRARVGELESKLDDTHTHRCWHCENTVTEATSKRQMSERDALRAECERLSKLHEQDKAELVRWRKAATKIRAILTTSFAEAHRAKCECLRCLVRYSLDAAEKP